MTTKPLIAFWISTKDLYKALINILNLSISWFLNISKEFGLSDYLYYIGAEIYYSIEIANFNAISSGLSPPPPDVTVLGDTDYRVSIKSLIYLKLNFIIINY
jgi:hypothetical protein